MSARISLTLIATSLFAAAAIVGTCTHSAAQGVTATELSAQQDRNKKPASAPKAAPHRAAPHAAPHAAPRGNTTHRSNTAHRSNQKTVNKPKGSPKVVTPKRTTPKVVTTPKGAPPKGGGAAKGGADQKGGAGASANAKAYTPSGPHAHTVTAGRLRGMPSHGAGHTHIGGHNYSVWRSGYRVRYGGGWRTFVAVSAITALAIGASTYYPYAYIEAPQPYCDGLTPDGCQLVWQEVPTVEGGAVAQCVAFCPWQ